MATVADLEAQAIRLRQVAKGHMRDSRRHRRRAREAMAQLAELVATAKQQGFRIDVEIIKPTEGGPNGNQRQDGGEEASR